MRRFFPPRDTIFSPADRRSRIRRRRTNPGSHLESENRSPAAPITSLGTKKMFFRASAVYGRLALMPATEGRGEVRRQNAKWGKHPPRFIAAGRKSPVASRVPDASADTKSLIKLKCYLTLQPSARGPAAAGTTPFGDEATGIHGEGEPCRSRTCPALNID